MNDVRETGVMPCRVWNEALKPFHPLCHFQRPLTGEEKVNEYTDKTQTPQADDANDCDYRIIKKNSNLIPAVIFKIISSDLTCKEEEVKGK